MQSPETEEDPSLQKINSTSSVESLDREQESAELREGGSSDDEWEQQQEEEGQAI